jgi:hypothetical protein
MATSNNAADTVSVTSVDVGDSWIRGPQSTGPGSDEDSDDEAAYDVLEEVNGIRTVNEADAIKPIVPEEYKTVDKLVEDQKKTAIRGIVESGDGLKNAMLKAYRNYRTESVTRQREEKKGPVVVDAMALLPKGYRPPRRKASVPTKPQPPTWGQRPSNPSSRRHSRTSNVPGTATSSTDQLMVPKAPPLPSKAPLHLETAAAAAVAVAAAEPEDPEVVLERKYRESQEQMRVALIESKIVRDQSLLMYVMCLKHTRHLRVKYARYRFRFLRAVRRVQRFVREDVIECRRRKHWSTVSFPMKFIMKSRVYRKKRALRVVKWFIRECASSRVVYFVKIFARRVMRCVTFLRSFVQVYKARKIMLRRLWEKIEVSIRRRADIADKKEARRLKSEMERRLLTNANAASKRQRQTVHAQWLEQAAEVKEMLVRSDLVQKQHRASLRSMAIACGEVQEEGEGDGIDIQSVLTSSTSPQKPKAKAVEYDMIDSITVDKAIRRNMHLKRVAHIKNIVAEAKERLRVRGAVDVSDVKNLLKAERGNEEERKAALCNIENHMMHGLNRVNNSTRSDFEERPTFKILTGKNLGKSWHSIVEEAVEIHTAAQSN